MPRTGRLSPVASARFRPRNTLAAALLLLASLALQGSDRISASTRPQFTRVPSVQKNPNPAVPLAAILTFATDRPVRAALYLKDNRSTRFLFESPSFQTEFSLPILGLHAATTHAIHVVITDQSGNEASWIRPLMFRSDPLPSDFPLLQTSAGNAQGMEPGITLCNLNQAGIGLMVAVDERGEVIWYYRQTAQGIGDIRRTGDGHLLFMDADSIVEIDMLGNVYQQWRPADLGLDTFHHEIYEMVSGHFLTLSTEARPLPDYPTSETNPAAPAAAANVVGDVVAEFDRSGRVFQRWSLLDILDPYRIAFDSLGMQWNSTYPGLPGGTRDWSHGNAVIEDRRDDSYIVSLRNQDALVKIDRKTGGLVWILGTPEGWNAPWNRYLLRPVGAIEWPYHQHAPEITPDGTILLFDNGNFRHRPFDQLPTRSYSRVAEFKVDEKNMTVSQVWSYGPDQELFYSGAVGDADLLPVSKNILVTDGFRVTEGIPDNRWARIFEITRATPAQKVFELTIRDAPGSNYGGWRVYRAERLPSLYPTQ